MILTLRPPAPNSPEFSDHLKPDKIMCDIDQEAPMTPVKTEPKKPPLPPPGRKQSVKEATEQTMKQFDKALAKLAK